MFTRPIITAILCLASTSALAQGYAVNGIVTNRPPTEAHVLTIGRDDFQPSSGANSSATNEGRIFLDGEFPTSIGIGAQLPLPVDPLAKTVDELLASASINRLVAERAVRAMYCAQERGETVNTLIVADMSMSAQKDRLWAFDMRGTPRLVLKDRVAHGSGSDPKGTGKPQRFSNEPDSHMTSLGLYRVAERYQGKYGWSRKLDGMFKRWNDRARERAVVMHPSRYVTRSNVGRSQGCPAVSFDTMRALEKAGLAHAVLWIDGPDKRLTDEVAKCSEAKRAELLSIAWADYHEQSRVLALNSFLHGVQYGMHANTYTPWLFGFGAHSALTERTI